MSRVVSVHPELHACQKISESIATIATDILEAGFVSREPVTLEAKPTDQIAVFLPATPTDQSESATS
jgi:hypothetical protein